MKFITTALAGAAMLALTVPAGAQMYPTYSPPAVWPEMVDNGCCTDFPTHAPSDFVADQLNRQVLDFNAGIGQIPMPMPR